MPRGDGTGPAGMGPMTGRAAGYCAGYGVPGYMNPVPGRGWGFGRGLRLGFRGGRGRWGAYAGGYAPPGPIYAPAPTSSPQQELDALKNQADYFRNALNDIEKRIEELEKSGSDE